MPRRILSGEVVSAKSQKTIIVKVERKFRHPIYKKIVKLSKKYAAHDSEGTHKEGDLVKIMEFRPISKTKRWTVCKE